MTQKNESELEIIKLFNQVLENISEQAQSPIELVHLWVNIGRKMGVEAIIPHLKVILYEHEEDEDSVKTVVGVIASPSSDVVEHLSSEEIFTEMICNSSVLALKRMKEEYH